MSKWTKEFKDNSAIDFNADAEPQLLWIDIETTGLEEADVILEFGMCVSDVNGTVIPATVRQFLVREHTSHWDYRLSKMTSPVRNMHQESGLLDELDSESTVRLADLQKEAISAIGDFPAKSLLLAGSSVHFDGGFVQRYLPRLYDCLHYRQVNVSTLKELCRMLSPEMYKSILEANKPRKLHRSMPDIADSINEYLMYLDNFLWLPGDDDD